VALRDLNHCYAISSVVLFTKGKYAAISEKVFLVRRDLEDGAINLFRNVSNYSQVETAPHPIGLEPSSRPL
jgi:hypothetical protein